MQTAPAAYAGPSARAQIITRRTYNRALDDAWTVFETWAQTIDRVIGHQRWLWEQAQEGPLTARQEMELRELRELMLARKALLAGRTLWLGGTDVARRRASSNFNCSGAKLSSIHDLVDIFWLLLQGAGTGFKPVNGALSGFARKMEIEVLRSTRTAKGGREHNVETFDRETGVWTISVGDSAEAWAKSAGKLVVGRFPARKLVVDLGEIRPAGERLKGYGWICSGDANLARAYAAIAAIRNRAAGRLLSKLDLLDITNWLGTVLSSRRSAQSALMDFGDPEWEAFATAKPPGYWEANPQRAQSNNGLMFWEKPSARMIRRLFDLMVESGGSEPSFNNAAAARKRAPWFDIYNPCYEILLANHGFCNLCNTNVARFADDAHALHRALWLMARANYRQTLVNLRDGILQDAWHENNEALRLCGVSLTGLAQRPDLGYYELRQLRNTATAGAYSMADELGLERPKNVTSFQPAGTLGKIMDATEGAHLPLGRYIFNHVSFSRHSPQVGALADAGYAVRDHPTEADSVLVCLPVCWSTVPFDTHGGMPVNREPAIAQLERYRLLQEAYVDQNTSITVSYDPSEVPAMTKWFDKNWDAYIGVAFLFRNDPTKTAADLGHAYLPQAVVTRAEYEAYVDRLKPLDIEAIGAVEEALESDCTGGACPIR
jgi:ribonucleoside-triphosphate reductase